MIHKREYNPELSVFSNLVLDLADFKDRVRPLAKDISLMDVSRPYQKHNVREIEEERQEFQETIRRLRSEIDSDRIEEEGYTSREIEASDKDEALDD